MKKILECSSYGDKRYSAYYAEVNMFGVLANIEYHYQNCKKFNNKRITKPKGKYPHYIVVNNINLDVKYLSPYYKLLWMIYLDEHPELVEYAKKFDDYSDRFKGKSINCQADVIRQYIKEGRDSVYSDCIELISILNTIYRG